MNDSTTPEDGEPKRRSFSDTLSLFRPIVPLPGGPVQPPPAVVAPVIPEADLPDMPGPQAIPLPPAYPDRVAAPAIPQGRTDAAVVPLPGAAPATPPRAVLPPPAPVAMLEPEPEADVVISPMPRADAPARPDLAAASRLAPLRRRRRRLWPWAALLALIIAIVGAAALWVQQPPTPTPQAALATPPETAAAKEPEPQLAITERAPAPSLKAAVPAPPPSALPPPAPEPPAPRALEPSPAELPEPGPPPPLIPASLTIERIIIFHHPDSAPAEAAAKRITEQLTLLATEVETRTAAANFRLPTIRYFYSEDAAGAQRLATALSQPGAEWRIAAILTRRPRPQPGTFEVWLTVR